MRAAIGRVIYKFFGRLIWRMELHGTHRARVLIVNGSKILLTRSMIGKQDWELPGGGAEKSEDIIDAAVREIKEETGISLDKTSLTEVGDTDINENGAEFVSHFVKAEITTPKNIRKEWPWLLDAEWFDLQQLPSGINPPDKDAINKYSI